MKKRYVIIGTSAAGLSAARMLARFDKESHIICLSQEWEQPYNKCFLADYLSGETDWEGVQTTTVNKAHAMGINIRLGQTVTNIDVKCKSISLASGESIDYDMLFIGTGSSPSIPQIKGLSSINSHYTFHTACDAKRLLVYAKQHSGCRAVIIGAGLSGLECADSLRAQGAQVAVIERADHVLSRQVDEEGAQYIQRQMRQQGVNLHYNTFVDALEQQQDTVIVSLSSGKQIQSDIIVIAAGVRPNGTLAAQAGADMMWGGIVVDSHMRSSLPDVYAGGDVAVVPDSISSKPILSSAWPDACLQGAIAARAMVGQPKPYPGASPITSSSFFSLKFATCGPIAAPPIDCSVVTRSLGDGYQKFLIQNQRLIGFLTIGSKTYLPMLKRAVLTGQLFDLEEILG